MCPPASGMSDAATLSEEAAAAEMHNKLHEKANAPLQSEAKPLLPSTSTVVQAGAFGAAMGGLTTGVMEMTRVKAGEITTDEAIKNVVSASAQGAATMAVASVASQVVRSHPVFGIIALAAAGLGAFVLLSGSDPKPVRKKRTAIKNAQSEK